MRKPFNEKLWLGTQSGLIGMNLNDKAFQLYPFSTSTTKGLKGVYISALFLSSQGSLFMGTNAGMYQLVKPETGDFNAFTTRDGLANNEVDHIIEDEKGDIWICTSYRLSKFDPISKSFINYSSFDGLQDEKGVLFKSPYSSNIYYGGDKGVNRFDPAKLVDFDYKAPLAIIAVDFDSLQGIQKNNNEVSEIPTVINGKQLSLKYFQNFIRIKYSSLGYANPSKVSYEYKLEGLSDNWIQVGTTHEVIFNSLSTGKYTFRVRDVNTLAEAKCFITIAAPWWQTWWAFLIYAALSILLIWLIVNYQYRRWLLQKQLKLKATEAEKLKEVDAMKTQFFTNITHEFRTPLTVILGISENLTTALEKEKIAATNKSVSLIQSNAQKLLRLISQILDLAKLDVGKLKPKMINGDLVNYLFYLSNSYKSLSESKGIYLDCNSGLGNLHMDYDEEWIAQIVTNLLSNAIKFTPEKGMIKIDLKKIDEEGKPFAIISIQDSGIGIAKDNLPHVFDRFFQVDDSKSQQSGGTGVGLALVKELVDACGGRILVESKINIGTNFKVFLPITQNAIRILDNTYQHDIALNISNDFSKEEQTNLLVLSNEENQPTLLIVEDSPDIVYYLKSCLEDQYQIEVAINGQAGIDKAIEIIPDVIISDVMMPIKDGLELCDTLKNDERTSHIPIVILTAKASVKDRLLGLRKGADAYLPKPFVKEELFIRLEQLVQLRTKLQVRYQRLKSIENKEDSPFELEDVFVLKAIKIIEEHLDDEAFGVQELADNLFLSRTQVHRKLKALTGKSIAIFIRSIRLQEAETMLEDTAKSIKEIAYDVGFKDPAYFSRVFSEEYGKSPSSYRTK